MSVGEGEGGEGGGLGVDFEGHVAGVDVRDDHPRAAKRARAGGR